MIPRGAEQTRLVETIFSRIAGHYDLANRLMTVGHDLWWRRVTARWATTLQPAGGRAGRYLDVATGTGDLALALGRARPGAEVVGLDLSQAMLGVAADKAARSQGCRLSLVQGDAFYLPFPDDAFDGVTIGFGVRNLPDHLAGLREMTRVVRPGGRVCILETHWPGNPFFRAVYGLYFCRVLPALAPLLTGDAESYQYLVDSTLDFPPAQKFLALMAEAGLSRLIHRPLTMGTVALYIGTKTPR
ncbi:MAG: ubiquinone/menaquinone biosynthesis methyltransferase [Proteobacteria bacterium]|nr:ubiquinone/menaquinone biosynthesis methyltransferase [Pseudomonadota bacterium]MBU1742473.1 ubiquinone/menaquinone biosynthesis methyltransferase [Pseudomonadota bacterium]